MSELVGWIAAEGSGSSEEFFSPQRTQGDTETTKRNGVEETSAGKKLLAHVSSPSRAKAQSSPEFCGTAEAVPFQTTLGAETRVGQPIELWEWERERRIYRRRTVAMLRLYMRYSLETGRLPSLVGREYFRSNVTKYRVTTFEDRVIFVHDMERCLGRLDAFAREVLGRIVLQEYEHEEVAQMFGCTRMTVHRKLLESLDQLSEILLEVKLLDDLAPHAKKSCQGAKVSDFLLSDCAVGK